MTCITISYRVKYSKLNLIWNTKCIAFPRTVWKINLIYSMKCIIISYIVWNFKWSLTYSMKCIAISCEGTKILCQMEAFKLPNPIHRIKNNFHFSKAQKKRRNRQKYKAIVQSLIHISITLTIKHCHSMGEMIPQTYFKPWHCFGHFVCNTFELPRSIIPRGL